MLRKTALVIEDEPAVARACLRALERGGFQVDIAQNGLIAIDMTKDNSYDVCLSDIKTPVMGGIEFYSYLREQHNQLADKVIFTSGDILSGTISDFIERTHRPFLAKPFTPDDLLEVIRAVIAENVACGSECHNTPGDDGNAGSL
jgi:CheY-like chemotaxis protein